MGTSQNPNTSPRAAILGFYRLALRENFCARARMGVLRGALRRGPKCCQILLLSVIVGALHLPVVAATDLSLRFFAESVFDDAGEGAEVYESHTRLEFGVFSKPPLESGMIEPFAGFSVVASQARRDTGFFSDDEYETYIPRLIYGLSYDFSRFNLEGCAYVGYGLITGPTYDVDEFGIRRTNSSSGQVFEYGGCVHLRTRFHNNLSALVGLSLSAQRQANIFTVRGSSNYTVRINRMIGFRIGLDWHW